MLPLAGFDPSEIQSERIWTSGEQKTQGEMRKKMKSQLTKTLVVIATIGLLAGMSPSANAANKSITCYKGTAVKKVTAANPKCPAGYTTTKPKAATSAKPATTGTTAGTSAINATYKGTMKLLWSDADVDVQSIVGTGSGTTLGLDAISGTPQSGVSSCTTIVGQGTLSGGANSLKFKLDLNGDGCPAAAGDSGVVKVNGTATVIGGTGKYATASGTLKTSGSFTVKSATGGTSESSSFTLTMAGNVTTK
ncbi:MAG: hypothetical protein RL414_615 [Actinomycetota bacterium]